jgi:hypothetical protein
MKWTKDGLLNDREYHADGSRGSYKINLNRKTDRWAIYLNGELLVENIYYEWNAERIAARFDITGKRVLPDGLRPRPDGGRARFIEVAAESVVAATSAPAPVPTLEPPVAAAAPIPVVTARDPEVFAANLAAEVRRLCIDPDRSSIDWSPWKSGLYNVLDAVFSAQTRYDSVVMPLLRRYHNRPGMSDCPERAFGDFVRDVDTFGGDRFERYASQVLNRQSVGGRLKVAVVYDAAQFFASRGVHTIGDMNAAKEQLRPLILDGLQSSVPGFGSALANHLLVLLGDEDRIKLDTMVLRFWSRIDSAALNPSIARDFNFALDVFTRAAQTLRTTPARLDKAVWDFETKSEMGVL